MRRTPRSSSSSCTVQHEPYSEVSSIQLERGGRFAPCMSAAVLRYASMVGRSRPLSLIRSRDRIVLSNASATAAVLLCSSNALIRCSSLAIACTTRTPASYSSRCYNVRRSNGGTQKHQREIILQCTCMMAGTITEHATDMRSFFGR